MAVPVSVDVQIRRLEKNLKELDQIKSNDTIEEESIIVSEICNSGMLLLDKAMNAVWEECRDKRSDKKKPNIYFPLCSSEEKFFTKLQQYQLPNLKAEKADLLNVIESVQAYKGVRWLPALYKLSQIRHENFPKINKTSQSNLAIGVGQDLYVEKLLVQDGRIVEFSGHGINRRSRKIEPARAELISEFRSILEGVGQNPFDFCSLSVRNIKRLTSQIYGLL